MGGSNGLNGQWIGIYSGTSPGSIIVNIDEQEPNYRGVAYLLDDDNRNPGSAAFFSTPNKDGKFNLRTDPILAIDRPSGEVIPFEGLASKIQEGFNFPKYADVEGSLARDALTLSWVTDIGTTGTCVLPRSKADKSSELVPMEANWGTYKEHVCELLPKRYLFRGQNEPWRLRTAFHRAGRADLHRYLRDDIPAVHRHLSARTKHVFNIRSKETEKKKYLGAIDLPVSDRRSVMRELSYMGITAGALFPGLDGACEELKERNFEI